MSLFILVFCCVISLACLWMGTRLLSLWLSVNKWDKIRAHIVSKSIEQRKRSSASRAGYKAAVVYTYKHNGAEYKGTKLFLIELLNGERGFLKSAAEKFLENLPNETEIHVNPQNPQESVVFCDGLIWYIITLLMAPLSLLLGLANYLS